MATVGDDFQNSLLEHLIMEGVHVLLGSTGVLCSFYVHLRGRRTVSKSARGPRDAVKEEPL